MLTCADYAAKHTDEEYLCFDPFGGDRDVDIRCHRVTISRTRKEHACTGWGANERHFIAVGSRVYRENAIVDGEWGTSHTCLACMDKMMTEVFGSDEEFEALLKTERAEATC